MKMKKGLDNNDFILLYYPNNMEKGKTDISDPLIKALKTIKEDEKLSIRDLARELGVHYLTIFAWFHGTPPSNLSRRVIKQYLINRL